MLSLRTAAGTPLTAIAPASFAPPPPGAELRLAFDPARAHLFEPASGLRIGTAA